MPDFPVTCSYNRCDLNALMRAQPARNAPTNGLQTRGESACVSVFKIATLPINFSAMIHHFVDVEGQAVVAAKGELEILRLLTLGVLRQVKVIVGYSQWPGLCVSLE